MDDKDGDVFHMVDCLINYPDLGTPFRVVFSQRLGRYVERSQLAALEEKVWEWSKEQPVIWNVGIGAAASFVPTLTRLLFERTTDLYGPYDQITRVRLPPVEAESSSTAQRRLAFQVLTELATTLEAPLPEDIKQLAAERSYFAYGQISDNLMLQAFGQHYVDLFGSDGSKESDQPKISRIVERTREALQGKRHLLVLENLHVPISLDVFLVTMGARWPSTSQNRRWLISTTSKDVCERSRTISMNHFRQYIDYDEDIYAFHLTPEYYSVPPYHGLRIRDWAMLIKEALWDAAKSIYTALEDKGYPVEFWFHVAQQCLYYAILYHPLKGGEGDGKAERDEEFWLHIAQAPSFTSDELVRCWVAEDLLFSTAIATDTPAATRQKQSNYYRSAFEAGKVVIQALQEYSLLPIYPVSSTTSSLQDVITGVSKLAEDVPRRLTHVDFDTYSSRWISFMNGVGRHVSWDWWPRGEEFGNERIPIGGRELTTLILRGCSRMLGSSLNLLFASDLGGLFWTYVAKQNMSLDRLLTPQLRVLDLSYTPINSIHPSISNLLNLYLLSLRGCSQLQTLSPPPSYSGKQTSPLAHLENLEVLDMNGVPLLELTQQDGCNKSNLHYLDLSGSKFTTMPSEYFCEMSNLEELILGKCSNLKELPPSIAQLSNLLVLHVEGTQITSFPEYMFQAMQRLHTLKLINNMLLISLPMSLSKAKALKELHISNCITLKLQALWEQLSWLENLYIQTWEGFEDIKILGHPNLRTFSLSGPWARCLSLRGCSKLKSVNFNDDLTALEAVDLSRTPIEEVPHNLPNLPNLNMLLLLGVPCSMRFPWHLLVRFPKVFYLDHCEEDDSQIQQMFCQQKTCGDENQQKEKTTNTARVKINDPRMFHSFNANAAKKLVKGQFLKSFNVQVKPCSVTGKKPRNNDVEQCARIPMNSTYLDIQYLEASSIMPMMKLEPLQRHVEISALNKYPNGLRHILSVTNSIFITDDAFVRSLTDLSYNLYELAECQLQRCHQMTTIFIMHSSDRYQLPDLQILQVFHLNNLQSLVEASHLSYSYCIELYRLKHIHLEHCPQLEKMFPCSLSLPALETLVILFCSNLRTIFYKRPDYEVARSPFPNIKSIYLQELPQLLNIHDDVTFRFAMPKWEKLFVRGCQSFHHLPLLKMKRDWWDWDEHVLPKSKVVVSGEREWWDRLHLKLPEQSDYYFHVAPPEFVSRKKHIIKSYLR